MDLVISQALRLLRFMPLQDTLRIVHFRAQPRASKSVIWASDCFCAWV